jgi:hypothetical protein
VGFLLEKTMTWIGKTNEAEKRFLLPPFVFTNSVRACFKILPFFCPELLPLHLLFRKRPDFLD